MYATLLKEKNEEKLNSESDPSKSNLLMNPAQYAAEQILHFLEDIKRRSEALIKETEKKTADWRSDCSTPILLLFCCACFPCCLVLTISEVKANQRAEIQANNMRLSPNEIDAIKQLANSIEIFIIKPSSSSSSASQSGLFSVQSSDNIKNAASKVITAIQNALLNPEIKILRSNLQACMTAVATAHEISLGGIAESNKPPVYSL